jgi:hypothetical protein
VQASVSSTEGCSSRACNAHTRTTQPGQSSNQSSNSSSARLVARTARSAWFILVYRLREICSGATRGADNSRKARSAKWTARLRSAARALASGVCALGALQERLWKGALRCPEAAHVCLQIAPSLINFMAHSEVRMGAPLNKTFKVEVNKRCCHLWCITNRTTPLLFICPKKRNESEIR